MFIDFDFTNSSMFDILKLLKVEFSSKDKDFVTFEVLNPDYKNHAYAGEKIKIDSEQYIYRGYKSWCDLAEILKCKISTPIINRPHTIILKLTLLKQSTSFHKSTTKDLNGKYGVDSLFASINKNEEPAFLEHYLRALKNVNIFEKIRILNLGINSGDEFEVIGQLCDGDNFDKKEFIGIDFSSSAINKAKERFNNSNFQFFTHDINKLSELDLGLFDLIITIGTLQSSGLEFKPLFTSLVQHYLKKDGAIIMGFPNCRWIDGEMIYGSSAKNYNFSEHTLLYKDIYFCKKYLQQKKFRVSITGKNYPFLTATSIRKENNENV